MKEIEVKVIEINMKETIEKLISLGAKKIFSGDAKASYFDFPNGKLSRSKKILRLRQRGKIVELTYKEILSKEKAKIAEEIEVTVSDFRTMKELLLNLGYREIKTTKKRRVSYSLGRIHFDIDTYHGIPTILEIEAPTVEELKIVLERLEIPHEKVKSWSGKDLMRHYGENK